MNHDCKITGDQGCRVARRDRAPAFFHRDPKDTPLLEWVHRGDAHRDLVFNLAHRALAKAKLRPPRTFKEAKIADEMARKACGLDVNEGVSQSVLIHVNELIDGHEPEILEASVVGDELSPANSGPVLSDSLQP